jgi:hypothetical protein
MTFFSVPRRLPASYPAVFCSDKSPQMEGESENRANEFPADSSIHCHGFRFLWEQNVPRRTGFSLRIGEEHGGIRDRQRIAPNRARTLKIEERGDAWAKKIYPAVRLSREMVANRRFPARPAPHRENHIPRRHLNASLRKTGTDGSVILSRLAKALVSQ